MAAKDGPAVDGEFTLSISGFEAQDQRLHWQILQNVQVCRTDPIVGIELVGLTRDSRFSAGVRIAVQTTRRHR